MIDNGFSGPKRGDLLIKAVHYLRGLGYRFVSYLNGGVGNYAAKMVNVDGFPFMLVAKGSALMGDIISFQKTLVKGWKGPIVLAWKPVEETFFMLYCFDPTQILIEQRFENVRGVEMINFSIRLGKRWIPNPDPVTNVSINRVWSLIKGAQTKLGDF